MAELVKSLDLNLINFFKKVEPFLTRFSLFLVYFWFGLLKIIGLSPAGPLVKALFDATISFIPFDLFYMLFSIFEVLIGILFLIKGWERVVIVLVTMHLITTILPLVFLPADVWQGFMVPTLEGQYIIKNILIAALAVIIGSRLIPISSMASKQP